MRPKITMTPLRIAVAGFGNVGRTLAEQLGDAGHRLGVDLQLVGVSDPRFGTVIDNAGLDGAALGTAAQAAGSFTACHGHEPGIDTLGMLDAVAADVLVELTFTDLATAQPALQHIETAIAKGMHVSTTNKGPIALRGAELEDQANDHGVVLAYEGTVMSGTPAVAVARDTIRPAGFRSAIGILNGTTNYMLERMEEGLSFDDVLGQAQQLGYAEADPTSDIGGHDAAAKLVILTRILTGNVVSVDDVRTTPLTLVEPDDIQRARTDGAAWKYVAELDATDAQPSLSVGLRKVAGDHPLSHVGGATNAITFVTEHLGSVTLSGPGAGRTETATAVLSDLLMIHRCR